MEPNTFYTLLSVPSRADDRTLSDLQSLTARYPWFSLAHQLLFETEFRRGEKKINDYTSGIHAPDRSHFYRRLQQPTEGTVSAEENRGDDQPEQPEPAEPFSLDEPEQVEGPEPFVKEEAQAEDPEQEEQPEPFAIEDEEPAEPFVKDEAKAEEPEQEEQPEPFAIEDEDPAEPFVKEEAQAEELEQEEQEEEEPAEPFVKEEEQAEEPEQTKPSTAAPHEVKRPIVMVGSEYFHSGDFEDIDVTDDDPLSRFIAEQPKINPPTSPLANIDWQDAPEERGTPLDFVTETLAQIYEQQALHDLAIATYKKLILQVPEKSTYFAARIKKLKQLNT
jgi:hypothetical protein